MGAVLHPRVPPRRATARATTWWGKAWVRAIDEAAYADADLVAARAISRSGRIGQISVEPGRFVAAVEDEHGLWAVLGGGEAALTELDDDELRDLVALRRDDARREGRDST